MFRDSFKLTWLRLFLEQWQAKHVRFLEMYINNCDKSTESVNILHFSSF